MTSNYKFRCELLGHKSDVRALACTDDNVLVSASRDFTARSWGVKDDDWTSAPSTVYSGHKNYITAVAVHVNSEGQPIFYTGSNDKLICAYTLNRTTPLYELKGHEETVCALSVDSHGNLVSGSWDKTVKVWQDKRCLVTIRGHEAAVWCVLALPPIPAWPESDSTDLAVISGSADHRISFWRVHNVHAKEASNGTAGEPNYALVRTLTGHNDCVRSLAQVDSLRIVSASNDASIRAWDLHTGNCVGEFYGHTHYIYAVACRLGSPIFVSAGEDRCVRVWPVPSTDAWGPGKQFPAIQSIPLPCQSAWCIAVIPNGDIAVGGSDAVVRLFSADAKRQANATAIDAYEAALASSKINATDAAASGGDLDPAKLPGMEALLNPGKKEGQVMVVKQDDRSVCYQWSCGESRWVEIGDVVGGGESRLPVHNGKEYDFVFSVDISDTGQPLKLPFNKTQDPWIVAQKFIHEHELPQDYLDTVAQFIVSNAGPQLNAPPTDNNTYMDPYTGANRYIPGSATPTDQPGSAAKAAAVVDESYFHSDEFVSLKSIPVEALLTKLELFNGEITDPVDSNCLFLIRSFSFDLPVDDAIQLTNACLKSIHKWPVDKIFPFLDLLRCLVFWPAASELIFTEANWSAIYAASLRQAEKQTVNTSLVLRMLANALTADGARCLNEKVADQIPHSVHTIIGLASKLQDLIDSLDEDVGKKKQLQIALASLLHNVVHFASMCSQHAQFVASALPQARFLPGLCLRVCMRLLSIAPETGPGAVVHFNPDAVHSWILTTGAAVLATDPPVTKPPKQERNGQNDVQTMRKAHRVRIIASAVASNSTNGSATMEVDREMADWEKAHGVIHYWAVALTTTAKTREAAANLLRLFE